MAKKFRQKSNSRVEHCNPQQGAQSPKSLEEDIVSRAVKNTDSLTFDDYRGQVTPYLEDLDAKQLGTEKVWDGLKEDVLLLLRKIPVEMSPKEKPEDPELP